MEIDFVDWLQKELEKRGWNRSELVRQARAKEHKLTTSQLSRLFSREQDGTVEVIMAIADGLEISREEIFRLRGWLPSQKEDIELDPRVFKFAKQVSRLPSESREATLNVIEPLLDSVRQLTIKTQELDPNGHEYQN